MFNECLGVIGKQFGGDPYQHDERLSLVNLVWISREGLERVRELPIDKASRWLGFVHGCLSMRGLANAAPHGSNGLGKAISHPVVDATREMFSRYVQIIGNQSDADIHHGDDHLSLIGLARICRDGLNHVDTVPLAEISRRLGFVQGCLCMRGLGDVDQERDISRPLFHRAYTAAGSAVPPTLARDI